MDKNLMVIDNFLDDPDRVRAHALKLDFSKIQTTVPGVRSVERLVGELQTEVENKLKIAFSCKDIIWDWVQDSFSIQSCQQGTRTWIHVDNLKEDSGEWAAVLYLTPNPIVESGTAIFESHDNHLNTPKTVMNMSVGNVYNRLVAYRGKVLYHRSILPGFGNTLETSRLTQVFFFDVDG